MRSLPDDPVIAALRSPSDLLQWTLPAWEHLVRLARRADLLPRIGHQLLALGVLDRVPDAPRAHLMAALTVARAQAEEVLREVALLRHELAPTGVEPVLLKGAAYVVADLPAATGRLFSDIDILVPKAKLAAIEATLMAQGWATTHHSAYDQRYYREWMHELPPMQHIHRHTVLDMHHAILPETARLHPSSSLLLQDSQVVAPGIRALSPTDMVLHSMTHLLHNEETSHALRDLSDLDLLMRHFGQQPGFWSALVPRAEQLELGRVLYHGLRQAHRVFDTPIPPQVLASVATWAPPVTVATLVDALWHRAFRSPPAASASWFETWPLLGLYLRAHWLRMPPALLARHLATKAVMRMKGEPDAA